MKSLFQGLSCIKCGFEHSDGQSKLSCTQCGSFLQATYDLSPKHAKSVLGLQGSGMWRYFPLLPVPNFENVITLGEGATPLLPSKNIGRELGLRNLYYKVETGNPTGTFKDRGASVTASKCKEVGIKNLVVSSAGNAASSIAAYAGLAGVNCYALLRPKSTQTVIRQTVSYGAKTVIVEGDGFNSASLAKALCREFGWFSYGTPGNLYRVEGKKTQGYEIWSDLDCGIPDYIVCPTGGGTNIIAIWKAFQELRALGLIEELPRMVCIQASKCAPIVRGFIENEPIRKWENPDTIASGLEAPLPPGGDIVIQIVRESGGLVEAVDDEDILESMKALAHRESLFVEPSAAAALAGLRRLCQKEQISRNSTVVLLLTGTGLNVDHDQKFLNDLLPKTIDPNLAEFREVFNL